MLSILILQNINLMKNFSKAKSSNPVVKKALSSRNHFYLKNTKSGSKGHS